MLAESLGWPRLVGPYILATLTLAFGTFVIQFFLRPDPFLIAQKQANRPGHKRGDTLVALRHIRSNPKALLAILAISIGHIAMVSIMVMTPVHMAHVDVTLTVIGLVISIHVIGMYAFSPIVGQISDKIGRVKAIQVGVVILLLSALISGLAAADDEITLGVGLFLLGLGWSFTLIAGSALLSESVASEMKPASQGASDLLMNLSAAGGGALAGVIIGTLNYAWLCFFFAIPVAYLGYRSKRVIS